MSNAAELVIPECEQCGWEGHRETSCPYAATEGDDAPPYAPNSCVCCWGTRESDTGLNVCLKCMCDSNCSDGWCMECTNALTHTDSNWLCRECAPLPRLMPCAGCGKDHRGEHVCDAVEKRERENDDDERS